MSGNPYSDYFLKMLEQEQMLKRHGFDHWPDDEELLYYLCSVDDKLDAVIDRLDLKAEQTRRDGALKRLETIDAQTLLEQPFEKPPWVVEDLISPGLHLLVGAPKVGKSWLVLDLGLHVSEGEPFWGFATCSCDVLYLCLEDTFIRIQERLFRLTDEATPHFHFATNSFRIPDGLTAQLDAFLDEHPTTRLIIIDTFQVVRKPTKDNAYAADYSDLGVLKRFADERELAILLLHHTRKATDSDIFNTVSGTTGITGSADSTFILRKENRYDSKATLSITGRDVLSQEFVLKFHDCRWELEEKADQEELARREIPDAVMSVVAFMQAGRNFWRGSATELMKGLGVQGINANVFSKYLNEHREFMAENGIVYKRERTSELRTITLCFHDGHDGRDG